MLFYCDVCTRSTVVIIIKSCYIYYMLYILQIICIYVFYVHIYHDIIAILVRRLFNIFPKKLVSFKCNRHPQISLFWVEYSVAKNVTYYYVNSKTLKHVIPVICRYYLKCEVPIFFSKLFFLINKGLGAFGYFSYKL